MTYDSFNCLRRTVKALYESAAEELHFHNFDHIEFVLKTACTIAEEIGADKALVEAAALLHDVNYLVERGPNSKPEVGRELRNSMLANVGYTTLTIDRIEDIILESHTGYRSATITKEGMALSDADTLFKSLPITPILNAQRFCVQTGISIIELARKIVIEQDPLMVDGIYFYTEYANGKYLHWAQTNLQLWKNVLEWYESDLFTPKATQLTE